MHAPANLTVVRHFSRHVIYNLSKLMTHKNFYIIILYFLIFGCDSNEQIKHVESKHLVGNYIKVIDKNSIEKYPVATEEETNRWNKELVEAKQFVRNYATVRNENKIDFETLDNAIKNWLEINPNGNEFVENKLAILYGEMLCERHNFIWTFDNYEQDYYTVIHQEKLIDADPFEAIYQIVVKRSKRSLKDRVNSIKALNTDDAMLLN